MRIGFLHLSDLHLEAGKGQRAVDWAPGIAAAIHPEIAECAGVVVLLTGDLAYSGKKEEYDEVHAFKRSLFAALEDRGLALLGWLAVPGNHDCDFATSTRVRDALLKDAVRTPDASIVAECLAVQAPFWTFMGEAGRELVDEERLLSSTEIVADGARIRLLGFNSAWMSRLREPGGSIHAPVGLLERAVSAARSDTDIVVWMMHHPYGWFEPNDARALRRVIETAADVVVTGHEHDGGAYTRSYRTGPQIDYFEGGVLQENPTGEESSFNLVVVDVAGRRQRYMHFSRKDELYTSSDAEAWQAFVRNAIRVGDLLDPSDAFKAQLEDPGAAFQHPRQPKLRFQDIFVYPDVKDLPIAGGRERDTIRDIPSYINDRRRVMLVGPEKSGKTSILKRLWLDLRARGSVPLIADGSTFHPRDHQHLREELRALIGKQYSPNSVEPVMQLSPGKRALLLDNYHLVPLTRQGKADLLTRLKGFFDTIVLTGAEDIRLDYMSQAPEAAKNHPIFDFSHAEILQFGHVKRHEIISRWAWLGRDRTQVADDEVRREVMHAENLISSAIGKNLIPSFPVFVLILLHQLESGRAHDTGAGSQGYLYQSLIVASLSKVARNAHDIDSRFNYLTELAWHLADEVDGDSIAMADLGVWHRQYCERQLVAYEFTRYVDDLIRVGILRDEGDAVGFSYPYIGYFFVARYLKAHLHEDGVRELVKDLAGRLHDEQTATVMVFLAHLSSDPFVLDTMLEAATELFADQTEWDTTGQTKLLNTLVQETPKLAILRTSLEENRVEELRTLDERDEQEAGEDAAKGADEESTEDATPTDEAFEREIEPLLKFNSAMKTIQIIGQILRNYPGSIDGKRKVQLAEVCYRLGLRVLGFTFGSIEAHGDAFVKGLVAHVVRLRPEAATERVVSDANAFLFALCERFSFAVVRHISQSLGHGDLAPVFREVERLGQGSTAFRVIDLSIKLDHAGQLPSDEAIRLYNDEKGNTIVTTLVRHLVWYHLYIFPTPYALRQRLCSRLKIDEDTNLIKNTQKLIGTGPNARLGKKR